MICPQFLYIRRAEKFVLFIKKHEEETKLEIERKFLIKRENLPENLEQYPSKAIEHGLSVHRAGSADPQIQ